MIERSSVWLGWVGLLVAACAEIETAYDSDAVAICEPFVAETLVVPKDEAPSSATPYDGIAPEVCDELCDALDVAQDSMLVACEVRPPVRAGASRFDDPCPPSDTSELVCLWVVDCLGL